MHVYIMEYPQFDRTKFKQQSFQEADHQLTYWLSKTPAERLRSAYYLICAAWNLDFQHPPRIDKTKFSMRKHDA